MRTIDLNCDLGEGIESGLDAELMHLVTSANICCAAHAGSREETLAALRLALAQGVQVGAHPGYPDRDQFGRVELGWSADQIEAEVENQLAFLDELASEVRIPIRYVKPHGALYNRACRDEEIAWAVVRPCERRNLPVMGLPGSALQRVAEFSFGFIAEGFADRRYQTDGTLVPRSDSNAFVHSADEAFAQARKLLEGGLIQTLCVHGDNPQAIAFVQALRVALLDAGFSLQAFVRP